MDPNEENPYQAPQASEPIAGTSDAASPRPNVFDWFFAIFLGMLASAFVFVTTCVGGFLLLFSVAGMRSRNNVSNAIFIILAFVCFGLTIGAGIWAVHLYIKAVRSGESERMKPRDINHF